MNEMYPPYWVSSKEGTFQISPFASSVFFDALVLRLS